MTTAWQDDLRLRPTAVEERHRVAQVSADLLSQGIPAAPHVVAAILRRVDGDTASASEIAARLTPSQRGGHRTLPRLLPLVPTISGAFDGLVLDAADSTVLLLAALCTDDRVDLLADAAQRSVESLTDGTLAEALTVSQGRCVFADARMTIWLRHTVTVRDAGRAHDRLQRAHHRRGEHDHAAWHRARGTLTREPEVAPPLTAIARELNETGHPEWAFTVATEAAAHADGAQRDEARLVAGAAAVAAGHFEDAAELLGSLFPDGDPEHRSQALASTLIAETCVHGVVPVLDPSEHRPKTADAHRWHAWARTAGLAAVMCAERGTTTAMRSWLAEVREADGRAGAGGAIRESTVALCWILTGEAGAVEPCSQGPFSGGMVRALAAALDGDIDHGLQLLARTRAGLVREPDPLVAGFEHSPLVGAYLAVVETLLHFWHGDIGAARERLSAASVDLPIGVPFAGLGTALAQRLDIAVLGAPGVLPQALAETLPGGIRIDSLVDQGISAYLGGAHEQAATDVTLWRDRGAPEAAFAVPGLDEVGPLVEHPRVEPPQATAARDLRHRIRRIPEASWRRERDAIAEAVRSISSPFCRARVEAMLGSASIIHGDVSAGRRHLRSARSLFEDAGALAWRDVADGRLARLSARLRVQSAIATEPIAVIHDAGPIQATRTAWAELLRERELEVAMRVIEGKTNAEIATALDISVRTVEEHVRRTFGALGVRNRVELAVLAHRTGQHL